jgi:hypothetical protein
LEPIKAKDKEEIEVQQHFKDNASRHPNGRYEVALPWNNNIKDLATNYRQLKKVHSEVLPGQIVLVSADNTKRLMWPLGRVVKVFRGADDESRVAVVKTAHGEYTRPVQRLYPLEITSTNGLATEAAEAGKLGNSINLEDQPVAVIWSPDLQMVRVLDPSLFAHVGVG